MSAQRLASFDLNQSLACGLNFSAPEFVQKWVETRLRNFAGWRGQKLGLIARNGYTAVGKNWGHRWREDLPRERRHEGQECRDFLRLMHAHDRNWLWIVIEDRLFSGEDTVRDHALHCLSYAELFGETGSGAIPFGLVMKALVHLAEIAIGVPTGPYHLAMAKPGLPVVGLWTEHVPDWYDEPKAESRHLFSRNLLDSGALDRPASVSNFVKPSFQTTQLQTRFIPGEAVFAAVLDLLGNRTGPGMAPASTTVKAAPLHKGTGRFIAVTIGVGEKYQLLARLAAESCQRQTGLETVILGEEDMLAEQFTRSHFLKFSLFDRFPDVENILFFDADTLFLRRFDPWVFEACESVVAVRDHENADWIKADAKRAGIAASEYFNSGFFIVNRTHHSKMLLLAARLANEIDTPLHDQGPLNAARARLGIAVHWLDRAFNHLSFDGSKESERVVLAHFNGIANQSLEEIEKTYAFWRRHSEERKVPNV